MSVPNRSRKNLNGVLAAARAAHHHRTTLAVATGLPEPRPNRMRCCRRRDTFARETEPVRSRRHRSAMAETTVLAGASHTRQMTDSRAEAAERANRGQAALTVPALLVSGC